MKLETRPGPTEPSWGVVGRTTTGPLRSRDDREGLIREVESGVEYVLGDVAAKAGRPLPFPVWTRPVEGRYELDLGDEEAPPPISLDDLRRALHSARKSSATPPRERDLRTMDEAFLKLLAAIEALHALGLGAGLLQPSNVLVDVEPSGAVSRLLLPDVGFVYFRGIVPQWLRNGEVKVEKQAFAGLWDYEPQEMNERAVDRRIHPKLARKFPDTSKGGRADEEFDPNVDLRTAARLFAWLLSPDGKVRKTIPTRDRASWAKAEVWTVLSDVLSGEISSAPEFRARLEERPQTLPSHHFHEQVAPPDLTPPRRRWAGLLLVVLLLTGSFAGYWFFVRKVVPPRAHELCERCLETSPLYHLLDEYLAAKGDPVREVAIVERMYDSKTYAAQGAGEPERECRDTIRKMTISRLETASVALRDRAYRAPNPIRDGKEARGLEATFATLFALENHRKPNPDSEYPPWLTQLLKLVGELA